MRCCGYRAKSESKGEGFTLPVAVPKTELPLVFSFSPSINATPAFIDGELYEIGTILFFGIHHDTVDSSGNYIGVARFQKKGNGGGSKEFKAAESKEWTTLIPVLFQE